MAVTHARTKRTLRPSGSLDPVQRARTPAASAHRNVAFYRSGPAVAFPVQRKVEIGPANDRYEREADAVADHVVGGRPAPAVTPLRAEPLPAVRRQAAEEEGELQLRRQTAEEEELQLQRQPREEEHEPVQASAATAGAAPAHDQPRDVAGSAIRARGPGEPLQPTLRRRLETGLRADLGGVRVHEGARAQTAAEAMNARAFTHGRHIWLGRGASQGDLRLMAHEATHVVQQGAAPGPVRSGDPGGRVQRDLLDDAGALWESATETVSAGIWTVLEQVAPSLVPVLREIVDKGIVGFLKDRLAVVFDRLFAGLENDEGVLGAMYETFTGLLGRAQEIVTALASGDCDPLFAAVGRLVDAVRALAGDAWQAVVDFLTPIGDWFADVWDRFGTPIVDWVAEVAGETWASIENLGRQIWDWTEPLREGVASFVGDAWARVKSLLGLADGGGSGSDSEGGLVAWIQDKAAAAWDSIREVARPVIEPIQQAHERIVELLPLDAVEQLEDRAQEWEESAGAMSATVSGPDDVVAQQGLLRETVLPAIRATIGGLRERVTAAGAWVAGAVGRLLTPVLTFVGNLRGNALLAPFAAVVGFVERGLVGLSTWATGTVTMVTGLVSTALGHLARFVEPVFNTLQRLADVVSDAVAALPDLVFGPFWRLIPACLRDVIKDFVVDHILSHIPFFQTLAAVEDVWNQIVGVAMRVLTQVFQDGDIIGAAWTLFSAMLRLIGIPPELVAGILARALEAFTDIVNDPVGFLLNLLRAVKQGFVQFFSNILDHLLGGIVGWLFGQIENAGLTPPRELSLRAVLDFVMQVLGLTVDAVFEILARHIGRDAADRLRGALEYATGAWEWIRLLVEEGPGALWERLQERLSELWSMVIQSAVSWVTETIVASVMPRLLSMLDPTGVMAVVNSLIAIYDAIKSFVEYFREMLEIVKSVLEGVAGIARGAIVQAASFLEGALADAIPIAIGFLAQQAHLGDIGERIGEVIGGVRETVRNALDWLIGRAVDVGRAVIDGLRRGAAAVREGAEALVDWWRRRVSFGRGADRHQLYFEGEGSQADLMVASTPVPLATFLAEKRRATPPDDAATHATLDAVAARAREIEDIKTRGGERARSSFGREDGERIAVELDAIASLLESLPGEGELPPSQVDFETISQRINTGETSEDARRMTASVLSVEPGGLSGSQPTQSSQLWNRVRRREGVYVRGHLLNHHVHGPGVRRNLTPITGTRNQQMEQGVEDRVKNLVLGENKVVRYVVTAEYGGHGPRRHIPEEEFVPTGLRFELDVLKRREGASGAQAADWVPDQAESVGYTSHIPIELPADTAPAGAAPVLQRLNPRTWRTDGIDESVAMSALRAIPGVGTVRARVLLGLSIETAEGARVVPWRAWSDLTGVNDRAGRALFDDGLIADVRGHPGPTGEPLIDDTGPSAMGVPAGGA